MTRVRRPLVAFSILARLSSRRSQLLAAVDQALSSLQNFALIVVLARQLSAVDFGRYAIYALATSLLMGLLQAAICDVMLIEVGRRSDGAQLAVLGLKAAGLMSLLVCVGGLVVAILVGGSWASEIISVSGAFVFLAMMETLRIIALGNRDAGTALAGDSAWVVSWVIATALLHPSGIAETILVYGISSVSGILVIAFMLLRNGRFSLAPYLLDIDMRGKPIALGKEYASMAVGTYGLSLGLSATVGVTAIGALRGAQAVFGPLNTVTNAMRVALTPQLSAKAQTLGGLVRRDISPLVVVTMAVTLLVVLGLAAIPAGVGEGILGDTWTGARAILWLVALQRLAAAPTLGTSIALRSGSKLAWSTRIRSRYAIVTMLVAVAVSIKYGLEGAMWAWIVGTTLQSGHLWLAIPGSRHKSSQEALGPERGKLIERGETS